MSSPAFNSPTYRKAVIVGVGLLGGSIGLALRHRHLVGEIVGVGRPGNPPLAALEIGAVDRIEESIAVAARDADLIICCAPVQQIPEHAVACAAVMDPSGLITDVGSTKLTIAEHIAHSSAGKLFIGSHPLAGGTGSGCRFAKDDLLVGSLVVVTPLPTSSPELIGRTEQLWRALGARTSCMSPEQHDVALAQTSHLPHILAAALAGATPRELLPLTATGWQSTTRVAAGNAELWRQILEENRLPALQALQNFGKVLAQWVAALENNDGHALQQLLEEGKETRDALGS